MHIIAITYDPYDSTYIKVDTTSENTSGWYKNLSIIDNPTPLPNLGKSVFNCSLNKWLQKCEKYGYHILHYYIDGKKLSPEQFKQTYPEYFI
jgi:hypothetical protein